MESEKVKEIKEALECCQDRDCRNCPRFEKEPLREKSCRFILLTDILTLINELESENAELKKYKLDWLNSEKMHLQADMEETEFELASSNRLFEIVSNENKELKDRIAELEEENAKLNIELDKKDCIDYPCRLIEKEHLKQFAEKLNEKLNETLKEMINEKKNP